jgi:hypothetical protein
MAGGLGRAFIKAQVSIFQVSAMAPVDSFRSGLPVVCRGQRGTETLL